MREQFPHKAMIVLAVRGSATHSPAAMPIVELASPLEAPSERVGERKTLIGCCRHQGFLPRPWCKGRFAR
jgi:hypothetical protein